ncbi:hypothetical protein BEWA_041990 [Theileria equi strain WA]|uniref:Uncharacterized protein n=1 Tax=Theileria equi strain WA TaxID=1537102 RepID=L1LFN1_THEEQ|nr:hypothetical protein BEWA_041990 [Theileria equi strain WA]EKX74161.1 hypothetical protein BEWA_041990 [Theileria equi strain WA]|eukprot:XP_004833613.1 hypothetical protein BEWA_041990 [Theileria equi strain WA]
MSQKDRVMKIDISFKPNKDNISIDSHGRKFYYYKDESSGNYVTVEEYSGLKNFPGYIQVKHRAEARYKISEVKNEGKNTGIYCGHFGSDFVSIYYWTRDEDRKNPLLIEVDGKSEYYTPSKEYDKWDFQRHITLNEILKKLDKQNCSRNNAHIIDINRIDGNYNCPSCNKCLIELEKVSNSNYTMCDHHTKYWYDKVGRIKEGSINFTGLETISEFRRACVYHYKNRIPLIYLQLEDGDYKGGWFTREMMYGSNWILANNAPLSAYEKQGVTSFLKEINKENYNIFQIIKLPIACAVLGTFSLFSTCEAYCIIFSQDKSLILRGIRFLASLRS